MPRLRLALILLTPIVVASPVRADAPPSFLNEIEPLLTRQGCNQGMCHGKGSGQNGFRLSLRGYAPELDHRWLTRELGGRRAVSAVAEDSVLFTKPTGLAPHEGGQLFDRNSREAKLLLAWLASGMPGPNKTDPTLTRLELLPGPRTLKVGDALQLVAKATFSDGTTRDVTWLTKFESNDAGLIAVSPQGRVTVQRPGETAIRAAFLDQVAVVVLTVPAEAVVPVENYAGRNTVIDEPVFAKLAQLRIEPSGPADDLEFLRRASLDAIGTLPTPDEARAFLADSRPDKRARKIDELLARPEFTDFWAQWLGDLFQNRKERDHDVRGTKGVRSFHQWLRKQVAANRPWDELAREVLTATGKVGENPAVGYYIVTVGEHREAARSEVVASVAQAFLGTRIGCAQCHNHPLERYTQDDYYHFAGFFSRIRFDRKDPRTGVTLLESGDPDRNARNRPIGVTQPRTGAFLPPRPLDRSEVSVASNEDPRIKLAAWMTDPANESFSGAMVNRIWKHFFGVGLVEPVDDLRATNPPSNPKLWTVLNREFVRAKFDLKHLMRLILNSRAYQLSSATTPSNAAETRFHSHFYARRLPAEVLLDAVSQATGVPDMFPGYPLGMRAIQLPDPGLNSYFLTLFGRSPRVTACACERNGEVTMPQLLHLQNGDGILAKLKAADGRLTTLLKELPNDDALMDELFLATLTRLPRADERATMKRLLATGDPRDEVFRDLLYALLNSKEFAFNR